LQFVNRSLPASHLDNMVHLHLIVIFVIWPFGTPIAMEVSAASEIAIVGHAMEVSATGVIRRGQAKPSSNQTNNLHMSSASLPQYCQDKNSQTAIACIDKCYEEEVERESDKSTDVMGWDIAIGSIGGIVASIGSAIQSNMHTQAGLNAQNCEQLSATLITSKLVVMDEKIDKIKTHVQAALKAIERTHRKLIEVHASVQQMEKKIIDKLDEQRKLLGTMRLETLMTEFMRCAGSVQHAHAAAQGIVSDLSSINHVFEAALSTSNSDLVGSAQEFNVFLRSWEQSLPGRLDPIATAALDGLRCMSTLVANSGILKLHREDLYKLLVHNNIKQWTGGVLIMNNINSILEDVMQDYNEHNIFHLVLSTISQTQFILRLAPREGYWENFGLYVNTMRDDLLQLTKEEDLSNSNRKLFFGALHTVVPMLKDLKMPAHCPDISDEWILWTSYRSMDKNDYWGVHIKDLDAMLDERSNGSLYIPYKRIRPVAICTEKASTGSIIRWHNDYSKTTSELSHDVKAKEGVKSIATENAFFCRIQLVKEEAKAINEYHGCLVTEGQSPQSCDSKLKLACHFSVFKFRCQLPGCPYPKFVTPRPWPEYTEGVLCSTCKHIPILSFNDEGKADMCENTCKQLLGCYSYTHPHMNNCSLFSQYYICSDNLASGSCSDVKGAKALDHAQM